MGARSGPDDADPNWSFFHPKRQDVRLPPRGGKPPPTVAERARPQKRSFWPQNGASSALETAAPNGAELTPKIVVIILTPYGTVFTPQNDNILGVLWSKITEFCK